MPSRTAAHAVEQAAVGYTRLRGEPPKTLLEHVKRAAGGGGSRYGGWILFAASVATYVVLSVFVLHQPFHAGRRALRYFDLSVYRGAVQLILHGRSLYGTPILRGFPFTYPPLAAIVLTPLVIVPLVVDKVMVTVINIATLVGLLWLTLKIGSSSHRRWLRPALHDKRAWSLVGLAAAAALWLEPVTTTVGYGQIDIVIAALVVFDIGRADTAKSKGAAIGLAAGLKLTPLIFVPYLLLTGRRRAAAAAAAVFVITVALGFALLPSDAAHYWGTVFDSSRVGSLSDYANQSLQGAIARATDAHSVGAGWVALIAVIAVIGLAVAVRASRRGDEAAGFSLCAITGLLVSPISWTHHWVIAVPALFLLVLEAYERRARATLIAVALLAAIGYAYLPERVTDSSGLHLSLGGVVLADPYVLIGLLAIAAGCAAQYRATRRSQEVVTLDRVVIPPVRSAQ